MRTGVVLLTALVAVLAVAAAKHKPKLAEVEPDSCPPGLKYCVWGGEFARCLHEDFWCDGIADCDDRADERKCGEQCGPRGFRCDGKCIRKEFRCDGTQDCEDGADEAKCGTILADDLWTCGNGQTRKMIIRCDGWKDCDDFNDEKGCRPHMCNNGAYRWNTDGSCQRASHLCDGNTVHKDGRDEYDCPYVFTHSNATSATSSA